MYTSKKNVFCFFFLTQLVSKPNPACHHCQQCPSRIDVEYHEEWSKHWHPHCTREISIGKAYAEIHLWILDSCTNWLCLLSYSPSDLQPTGLVLGFWIATISTEYELYLILPGKNAALCRKSRGAKGCKPSKSFHIWVTYWAHIHKIQVKSSNFSSVNGSKIKHTKKYLCWITLSFLHVQIGSDRFRDGKSLFEERHEFHQTPTAHRAEQSEHAGAHRAEHLLSAGTHIIPSKHKYSSKVKYKMHVKYSKIIQMHESFYTTPYLLPYL